MGSNGLGDFSMKANAERWQGAMRWYERWQGAMRWYDGGWGGVHLTLRRTMGADNIYIYIYIYIIFFGPQMSNRDYKGNLGANGSHGVTKKIKLKKSSDKRARRTMGKQKEHKGMTRVIGVMAWESRCEKKYFMLFSLSIISLFPSNLWTSSNERGKGGQWGTIEFFMETFAQQMDGSVMKMSFKMNSEWWDGGGEGDKIVEVQWKYFFRKWGLS